MPSEPTTKRVVAFFDGQNLFHSAQRVFGYGFPNFDPDALARKLCSNEGWQLLETHFYTGVPTSSSDPWWNQFWANKLNAMRRKGLKIFKRDLRVRQQTMRCSDGSDVTANIFVEKGIDVRIALDIVRLAYESRFDIALIFSQDQDFTEVVREIQQIAQNQKRWIKVVSAFPTDSNTPDARGINGSEWIKIDKALYDSCIDPVDHRPKNQSQQRLPF